MKSLILASLSAAFMFSTAQASTVKISGLFQSNAGLITESLLTQAERDTSIKVDTSVYTITKVSHEDQSSVIECSRAQFSGPPPQYVCTIQSK